MQLNISPMRQRGVTLIELMISITLALVLLAALSAILVSNSRARDELDRAGQQIENGRYAMQTLSDDLQHSGYLSEFNIVNANLTVPAAKPNACATDLNTLRTSLPLHIQGYDNGAGAPACLDDLKANTDIVVVRHTSTCVRGSADCNDLDGAPYFQTSLCNTQAPSPTDVDPTYPGAPNGLNTRRTFRLDTVIANLDRTRRNCAAIAAARRYLTHIYFIANNDQAGDGVPTLKRAELESGTFTTYPVASGIEDMQLEFGIDTDNNGIADAFSADPDGANACNGAACAGPANNCGGATPDAGGATMSAGQKWCNTVAVKVHLLARSLSPSPGVFVDDKTYTLGLDAAGNEITVAAPGDRYKRHAFQTAAKLVNPTSRRNWQNPPSP